MTTRDQLQRQRVVALTAIAALLLLFLLAGVLCVRGPDQVPPVPPQLAGPGSKFDDEFWKLNSFGVRHPAPRSRNEIVAVKLNDFDFRGEDLAVGPLAKMSAWMDPPQVMAVDFDGDSTFDLGIRTKLDSVLNSD